MTTRERIITKALHCLSESTNAGVEFVEDNIIPVEQFVDEAGRRVIMLAPLHTLGYGKNGDSYPAIISTNGVVKLQLPQDFVRLVSFKMAAWKRAVCVPIYDTDPEYAMQFHSATRGGIVKPIVAIVDGGIGIEAYSTKEGDTIETFQYIGYKVIDNEFPEKLEEATAWMTASLYLASMGELDMSKVAEAKSVELLQLL